MRNFIPMFFAGDTIWLTTDPPVVKDPSQVSPLTNAYFILDDHEITYSAEREERWLKEICKRLAHERRFAGEVDWTVAHHSIFCEEIAICMNYEHTRAVLCHDFHEAFVKDIPSPLKKNYATGYQKLSDQIDNLLKLVCPNYLSEINAGEDVVHAVDQMAVYTEAYQLNKEQCSVVRAYVSDTKLAHAYLTVTSDIMRNIESKLGYNPEVVAKALFERIKPKYEVAP